MQKIRAMYKFTKDGVTVLTHIDTRRPRKDNTYPVKVQVVYKGKQAYFQTGKFLTIDQWEKLKETKVRELVNVRRNLENSFNKIRDLAEELISEGNFSFDLLNKRAGKSEVYTLNQLFHIRIEELSKEKRIGNMTVYKTVFNSINRFGGANIPITNITPEWLKKYQNSMKGKSQSTISIHLRTIRAIINGAKEDGLIKESQYPFGKKKFEIQEGTGRKLALTLEQIGRIANYECDSPVTERYRDMWLFIYLCNGINVADLIHLKYKNIVEDEIYYIRQKTKHTTKVQKEIVVTLSEPMKEIIQKWGNPSAPDNYIFPILSGEADPQIVFTKKANFNRELNKRMATIAADLGLPKISTYTARHSFATVLKRSGANIAFIAESLGHTDLKTTENYLASFEKDERQKNSKLLLEY